MTVLQGTLHGEAPPQVLLAYRGIDWSAVRRARFYAQESFTYRYPAPVTELEHRLMIAPPALLGDQRRLRRKLQLRPAGLQRHEVTDRFGNCTLLLRVSRVPRAAVFHQTLLLERRAMGAPTRLSPELARQHAYATALTSPDAALITVAKQLKSRASGPYDLAQRISAHVSEHMRYASGVTGVHTTAAQAYALGQGLCQDYAHIALCLCRAAGLPARYVSGHMPGEGSSHAWLEALIPDGDSFVVLGLDPTNAREPHLGYATISHGNDYRDVSPTSGVFYGPQPGVLNYHKHAGLVELEYHSGEVVRAQ